MSTSSPEHTCPRCGGPLPGATDGLCPRCLLAEAMEPTRNGEATASAPTLTPEELAPHFPALEIVRCLGRGGMGVVYEARQKSLNRRVALKLLAPERADDPRFADRFAREAQALAALSHPHIVAVHDFGRAGGFYYLIMEYVDGVNLRELLRSRRLSPREALSIVPPVCDALQCAHDHGIVHRDIKPENLLIDRAGTVKIADFGIAALVGPRDGDTPTADGAATASVTLALGTPDYAAPEQAAGAVDARADIYSLGIVLYEMLTGERPRERLEPPSRRVRLDVRIDAVVLRALERDPELRYATAADFRAQVEAFTVADPPPPPVSFTKIGSATLTTPADIATWRGQLGHSRTRGSLALDAQRLTHTRPGRTTVIPLADIEDLSVGAYPRSMNPHGLALLSLTYREDGQRRQVLLSPMEGWFVRPSTWAARVEEWRAAIASAVLARTGRVPNQTPPDQLGLPKGSNLAMAAILTLPIAISVFFLLGIVRPHVGGHPAVSLNGGKLVASFLLAALATAFIPLGPLARAFAVAAGTALGGVLGFPELVLLAVLAVLAGRRERPALRRSLPVVVWLCFHAAAALAILGTRGLLPEQLVSQFNIDGVARRWMNRDAYLPWAAGLPAALGLVFLSVVPLIRWVPARMIRVPRPDYWLAPERRDELAGVLLERMASFSCLFTLYLGGWHALLLLANLGLPPLLPPGPALTLTMGFLLLVAVWLAELILRLARAGDPSAPSARSRSLAAALVLLVGVFGFGWGLRLRGHFLRSPALRVTAPPEPTVVPANASDPRWMEVVREGGEKQAAFQVGAQTVPGWHRMVWWIRASRPGWVEIRFHGDPLISPLRKNERTGLFEAPLYLELRDLGERGSRIGCRLGEPEQADAPSAGFETPTAYAELSRELDERARRTWRSARGPEVDLFLLEGKPAWLKLLDPPLLAPSANRDMALSSAMEAIQTGQFCLLGISGQTPANLTHDAETGYPIVWLPAGGPAESLELFNETMRAWHRKQAESQPER